MFSWRNFLLQIAKEFSGFLWKPFTTACQSSLYNVNTFHTTTFHHFSQRSDLISLFLGFLIGLFPVRSQNKILDKFTSPMSSAYTGLSHPPIRWGKFSQKRNYGYMAKWLCLLAIENYMFRPTAAIIRFWQLSCYKIYIYYYI